jgi:hypothetical protein
VNAAPAEPVTDGVVYWDTDTLRWLPVPGRPVPAEPDPAALVAVVFTRTQVLALFGLLQWANQHSRGLAVRGAVRDAWCELSSAWARANPGRICSDDMTAEEASGPPPGRAG